MNNPKFCIKCGKSIPLNSEFCPYCGAKQPVISTTKESTTEPPVKKPKIAEQSKPTSQPILPKQPDKKWYKRWWVWVVMAVIALVAGIIIYQANYDPLGGVDTNNTSSSQASSKSSNKSSTTDSSAKSSSDTSLGALEDGTKITATGEKTYKPDLTDTSWENNELNISLVNVFATKPFKYDDDDDGKYTAHGMIYVEFSYTPTIDVDTLVNTATLSTNTGVQSNVDYMDSTIPDSIDSGVTKKFKLLFPLSDLSNAKDLNNLRLKFSMEPSEGDGDMHDYDLTVNLTN